METRIKTCLKTIMENQGAPDTRPAILLTQAGKVWFVTQGRVEIFLTRVKKKAAQWQPTGRRRHVCSIEADMAFFSGGNPAASTDHLLAPAPGSSPEEKEGNAFLAVPHQTTQVYGLALKELVKKTGDAGLGKDLARLTQDWVIALSAGADTIPAPASGRPLAPGRSEALAAREPVRAGSDLVWAEILEGRLLFQDTLDIDAPACIPMIRSSRLYPVTPARIRTLTTAEALSTQNPTDLLDRLQGHLLALMALNRQLERADQFNRLKDRVASARQARDQARASLATVLERSKKNILDLAGNNALLACCMLAGEQQGITITPPPKLHELPRERQLTAILRASHVRSRPVRLRGEWWTCHMDALLAFTRDNRPVVLTSRSGQGMALIDPVKGEKLTVDPALAQEIDPVAMTLYRPLASRPLAGLDLMGFIWKAVRRDLRRMLILGFLGSLVMALIPFGFRYLIHTVIPDQDVGRLFALSAALAAGVAAAALLETVRNFDLLRIEARADLSLQAGIMDRLLSLPSTFFRRFSAGDLTNRVMTIGRIRQLVSGATLISFLGMVFSLVNILVMFVLNAPMALLCSFILVMAALVQFAGTLVQLGPLHRAARQEGRLSGLVLQMITAIAKLRVAGAEPHAFAVWADSFSEQRQNILQARHMANLLQVVNECLPVILVLALVMAAGSSPEMTGTGTFSGIAAGKLAGGGQTHTGDFLAFYLAMVTFAASLSLTFTALAAMLQAIPLYQRMRPIVETAPEHAGKKPDMGPLKGGIEISNLSFHYHPEEPPALERVSLTIRPGEFTAFVGPSGSGKSTLLRLIMGFTRPDTGTISFDGNDLSVMDTGSVRRQMGVVLQNAQLIPGTILSNIIGARPLTADHAWEAAERAGVAQTIKELPMGMETVVGSGLSAFSGGERQRLMLARALAGTPAVLILDEATSALDNLAQAGITERLDRLNVTRLVVAHRLSTVVNADRIYVLDKGRIVEQGRFDQLMADQGLFAALASRQLL